MRLAAICILRSLRRHRVGVGLLVARSQLLHRRPTLWTTILTGIADRPWAISTVRECSGSTNWRLVVAVWSRGGSATVVFILIVVIEIATGLVLTTSHTDIASDADTASLFRDNAAQLRALRETGKLLRAEHGEGNRLDLEAVRDVSTLLDLDVRRSLAVHVLLLLQFLVQGKAQTVLALMTNGEIGEDEIASRRRTIKVGHASDWSTSQDGESWLGRRWNTALSEMASILEGGEEEEVCIVREGDVGIGIRTFKDAKLDNWWWIDRTTIGRSCNNSLVKVKPNSSKETHI